MAFVRRPKASAPDRRPRAAAGLSCQTGAAAACAPSPPRRSHARPLKLTRGPLRRTSKKRQSGRESWSGSLSSLNSECASKQAGEGLLAEPPLRGPCLLPAEWTSPDCRALPPKRQESKASTQTALGFHRPARLGPPWLPGRRRRRRWVAAATATLAPPPPQGAGGGCRLSPGPGEQLLKEACAAIRGGLGGLLPGPQLLLDGTCFAS